jgi:hypothetical protein
VSANGGSYFIASRSGTSLNKLSIDNYNYYNEPNPWIAKDVDGPKSTNVGSYPAAIMPTANTVYVSYFDSTNGDLRFITAARTYQTTAWVITNSVPVVLASARSDIGQYTSMASPDGVTVFISYYDLTTKNLCIAKSTDSGSTWTTKTIDSGGDVGQYTSIAVSGQNVYIAYYDATNTALKIAKSLDGGATW